MRLPDSKNPRVIAGKIDPQAALNLFYQKMATATPMTQQTPPVMTQQAPPLPPVIEPKPTPLPVRAATSITVEELKDKYIQHKEQQYKEGSFADRSLMSVREVVRRFAIAFPARTVDSLTVEDFATYRSGLAKWSVLSLNRHVMNIRAMFQWGKANYYLPDLPRWGTAFLKPSVGALAAYTNRTREIKGKKLFTPAQLARLLSLADVRMKAMIYLGINCGFGNTDVGKIPLAVLDFETGMMDYSRWKKGVERRTPLWPETIQALKDWLKVRPVAAESQHQSLVFLTATGLPVLRVDPTKGENGKRIDYITMWFAELLDVAKLAKKGLGFYAWRHTFFTCALQTKDIYAVERIMGHRLPGMAGGYAQQITDEHLRSVSDFVRCQMIGIDGSVVRVSSL